MLADSLSKIVEGCFKTFAQPFRAASWPACPPPQSFGGVPPERADHCARRRKALRYRALKPSTRHTTTESESGA